MMKVTMLSCLLAPALGLKFDMENAKARPVTNATSFLQLSNTIHHLAAALPPGATKDMMHKFRVCATCDSFVRVGSPKDDGYLMCSDGLKSRKFRAAYSMGVSDHDPWAPQVYNLLHVPVHQVDCTVRSPPPGQFCEGCKFEQVCVMPPRNSASLPGKSGGSAAGMDMQMARGWNNEIPADKGLTLAQILKLTHQVDAPDSSLIMKMDIEASEWPVFLDRGVTDVLKKFQQVIVEFHNLGDEVKHETYARAMQNILDAGLQVAHLHGNNYQGMYSKAGYSIPRVVEVTFIRGAKSLPTCDSQPQHLRLDAPNNARAAELPAPRLP